MNSSLIKGLIVGGVLTTACVAVAGYNGLPGSVLESVRTPDVPEFAQVLDVQPAYTQVARTSEVCEDVEVVHQAEPKDEKRIAGTTAGVIIGGLLGNQVGGGNGKKAATVLGAIAGGLAGNKIQEQHQAKNTYTALETQCEQVTNYVDEVIGYDVTYSIGDETGELRLSEKPGDVIPLIDGQLPVEVMVAS